MDGAPRWGRDPGRRSHRDASVDMSMHGGVDDLFGGGSDTEGGEEHDHAVPPMDAG